MTVNTLLTSEIMRPARYLGNELGSIHKPWDSAIVRWALTYPELYEVGASNLGHIILYSIVNTQPRQLCDRAYLPAPDLATKLRETQTPLFAVESRRSLLEFDILGFSLAYELGATNILEMLDLARIPLTWRERGNEPLGHGYPLIFAGGQTATSNPEPYADFLDFVALGDGEELLPEIGLVLEEGKRAQLSREALLLDLAQVPGVYVPRFYDMAADGSVHPNAEVPARILRRVATPMPAYGIGLVPIVETVHDRLTIEIRRGCTRGCRFCQPGMLTRPARDVDPDEVVEAIERGMRQTGYNEFSLLSLSCSDYLALPAVGMEVKNRLRDQNVSLSLPSQRVDRFDEHIANIIGGVRQTSITFAPEAGTQRLRDIINKGLTNEELLRGVKTAYEQGWDKLKLYFMIGLPGETDEDVIGIADTIRWLQQECRGRKKRLDINLTISNFTPKPHTPFQWHSVSTTEFRRKQQLLRQEFRSIRGLKANFTDVRISAMEDFVGRGDRRLAAVIRRAWELGAGMDAWWESVDRAYDAWNQAIIDAGLTWKYRQVEQGEWNLFDPSATVLSPSTLHPLPSTLDVPLPWDHLDTGIDKNWLKDDLEKALAAATVPDCSFEGCSHCGVCTPDFGHNVVVPPMPIPEFAGHFVAKPPYQRLRIRFGKQGDMALVGHLDLLRVFERAVRRAGLPIAFTNGFHPMPRIAIAVALPLGATSSGELMDIELVDDMDIQRCQEKLTEQLPADLPIYGVEAIDLKTAAAAHDITWADYQIQIGLNATESANESGNESGNAAASELKTPISSLNWQGWIDQLLAQPTYWHDHTTKSGKTKTINLREWLTELNLVHPASVQLPGQAGCADNIDPAAIVLRYVGACRNDGAHLKPHHVLAMLEQVSGLSLQLLSIHRQGLG